MKLSDSKNRTLISFLLGLLCLLSTACGPGHIEERFQPYVNSFKEIASAHGKVVDIEHVNVISQDMKDTPRRGFCYWSIFEIPTVYIDSWIWDHSGGTPEEVEAIRTTLVFHELGHCVLKKDHNDSMIKDGKKTRPASIMYKHSVELRDFYHDHREEYLAELFEGV